MGDKNTFEERLAERQFYYKERRLPIPTLDDEYFDSQENFMPYACESSCNDQSDDEPNLSYSDEGTMERDDLLMHPPPELTHNPGRLAYPRR
jgi:hypothetical protein